MTIYLYKYSKAGYYCATSNKVSEEECSRCSFHLIDEGDPLMLLSKYLCNWFRYKDETTNEVDLLNKATETLEIIHSIRGYFRSRKESEL